MPTQTDYQQTDELHWRVARPFWSGKESGCPTLLARFRREGGRRGYNHVTGFSYDSAGNMKQDNLGNTYSYDVEGRPTTAAGIQLAHDGGWPRQAL
ncbi:MAG: hypothetical protein WBM04_02405 [Candidatus Korobacteraceae bacterium]